MQKLLYSHMSLKMASSPACSSLKLKFKHQI